MQDFQTLIQENKKRKLKYPYIVVVDDIIYQLKYNITSSCFSIDERIGNIIRVEEILSDIQTREKKVRLRYKNLSGEFEEQIVDVETIADRNKIVSLSKYGVDISTTNAKYVLNHLNNEMRNKATKMSTSQMGVITYDNKTGFIGQEAFIKVKKNLKHIPIEYSGEFAVMTHGEKEVYMNMVQEEICPSVVLSAMMLIALSAPLVGYIGRDCNISNILTHVSGDSSTGKSTVLKFAVSLFGSYRHVKDKKGLFCSWNSTDNALMETLSDNMGIPLAVDELGMSKTLNFSALIYRLVEGKEKERMKFCEGNQLVREWHTSILSSGECLMVDENDQATGQNMRIIQISNCPWTTSAQQASNILTVISEHYGFLGLDFVKNMFRYSKESLLCSHQRERKKMLKLLKCGNLNERTADTLALIMIAGKILEKMGLDINLQLIREFLADVVNASRSKENSIGERAYERLLTEISAKQNSIERRTSNGRPIEPITDGIVWGVGYCVSASDNIYELAIPVDRCKDFLREKGFKSPDIIFDEWVTSKHIKTNKRNKYTHLVKIGSVEGVKCIKVVMPNEKE